MSNETTTTTDIGTAERRCMICGITSDKAPIGRFRYYDDQPEHEQLECGDCLIWKYRLTQDRIDRQKTA